MSVSKLENNGAKIEVGSDGNIDATCGAFRINSSPVGGGLVQKATVVLTDAQIKALPTTPAEIVPAQVGKLLVLISAVYVIDLVVGYTGPAGTEQLNVSWEPVNDIVSASGLGGSSDFRSTTKQIIVDVPIGQFDTAANIGSSNLSLVMVPPGGSNFTGGDPANTLTVTVLYAVLDV